MNISGLSFNALPPISLPFRFFITGPLFIIAMAILVLVSGESLWLSRWQPNMLALTHGFTLGFITCIMMGALLQILPVLGGIGFPKPRQLIGRFHIAYVLGTMSMIVGFIYQGNAEVKTFLTSVSILLLVISIGGYLLSACWVLLKKLSQGDAIIGVRLALTIFFMVFLLAMLFQLRSLDIHIGPLSKVITNVHAVWGLAGWAGLLIMSVSFQVIPMFHVAPHFPRVISKYLPWLIVLLLVFLCFSPDMALSLLFVVHGIFAVFLLHVIAKRKRKVPDTTILYWQLAAMTLLFLNVWYFLPLHALVSYFLSDHENIKAWLLENIIAKKTLLLTATFIYFYVVSVLQGMLIKILPFLSYTHLQQRCLVDFSAMQYIPNMHEFLPKASGVKLFYVHILTGFSLLLVIIQPQFYPLFGLLLLIEYSGLLTIMIKTMRLYFSVDKKISSLDVSE